jgi:tight adherence protein C
VSSDVVTLVASILVGALAAGLIFASVRAWTVRRRGIWQIDGGDDSDRVRSAEMGAWLRGWLSLAGYRRPDAALLFVAASATALIVGVLFAVTFRDTVLGELMRTVGNIPGGIGESLVAILGAGPWIMFVVVALGPTLAVRAARRRRVRDIEHDLPLALELFATLAEAGLSFDAALARILQAQHGERPLTSEFIAFQRDIRAGVPRVQALRRLAQRSDVTSMTVFLSAVIQSEQVGASIAETLRHQADDLRQRRREQALVVAQALPVKLVFPLIVCFLPGIFISTLGPVLYQMIQVADSVLRPVGR